MYGVCAIILIIVIILRVVDTPLSESRFADMLEGWVDEEREVHDEHDLHHANSQEDHDDEEHHDDDDNDQIANSQEENSDNDGMCSFLNPRSRV